MEQKISWQGLKNELTVGSVNGLRLFAINYDEQTDAYSLFCNFPARVNDFHNRKSMGECKLKADELLEILTKQLLQG